MKSAVVSDMNKRYLIIEGEECVTPGYQQKMVLHNKLPGILEIEQRQVDSRTQYYYDITGKITLCEYFEKNIVSVSEMEFIIKSVVKVIQNTDSYLLQQDNFILLPENIYVEEASKTVYLLFLEGYQVEIREQFVKIAEYFMEKIDYKDEDAVRLAYGLFKELRENRCSFRNLEQVLECCKDRKEEKEDNFTEGAKGEEQKIESIPIVKEDTSRSRVSYNVLVWSCNVLIIGILIKMRFFWYQYSNSIDMKHILVAVLILICCNVFLIYIKKVLKRTEENTLPAPEIVGMDTIVLPTVQPVYALKGEGRQQLIRITSIPFILGSDQRRVNGCIDVPEVSKQHAVLEKHNGLIQIKDLNSTNGTFVNGELLSNRELFTLKEGDKITLADITYKFIKL